MIFYRTLNTRSIKGYEQADKAAKQAIDMPGLQ